MKKYPIHPEVQELLKDRIVSLELMVDISSLLCRLRNEAYSAGFKDGKTAAYIRMRDFIMEEN